MREETRLALSDAWDSPAWIGWVRHARGLFNQF